MARVTWCNVGSVTLRQRMSDCENHMIWWWERDATAKNKWLWGNYDVIVEAWRYAKDYNMMTGVRMSMTWVTMKMIWCDIGSVTLRQRMSDNENDMMWCWERDVKTRNEWLWEWHDVIVGAWRYAKEQMAMGKLWCNCGSVTLRQRTNDKKPYNCR